MLNKVLIRVDGSTQIGLGHVVRCIALAQMLKDEFQIHFITKEIPDSIIGDIISNGFEFTKIETEETFFKLLTGKEIVVLDNYYFDTVYQKRIKDISGCKLVCIDDLHDKEFYADLIINHALGVKPEDYQVQSFTKFALGLNYALLRPAFLNAAKEERRIEKIETVFVCFGGSDIKNITSRCLSALIRIKEFKKIIVVLGASFRNSEEVKNIADATNRVEIHHGIGENKMLELLKISELAIVPASGILLEAISAGCMVISGMYADNQKFIHQYYKNSDLIIDAGNFSKENIISALYKLKENNLPHKNFLDGNSNRRILNLFKNFQKENEVILRKTEIDDVDITYRWAKDSNIRKYSFTRTEISFIEHKNWFINKIKNNQCIYFIAIVENKPIGSVRFDLSGDEAVISYLIDTKFHGEGFGIIILKKGVEILKSQKAELKSVVGYVTPENIASIKIFKRLGYTNKSENEREFKFIKRLN